MRLNVSFMGISIRKIGSLYDLDNIVLSSAPDCHIYRQLLLAASHYIILLLIIIS